MEKPKTCIYFFLKKERYAMRVWWNVPRVGDEVMLNFKGKQKAFKVIRVVWGVESEAEYGMGYQCANVEIVPAKLTPPPEPHQ